MENGNYGYEKPLKHNANFERIEEKNRKKSKLENKILITLPNGLKERLKRVAKYQEERYHTLATSVLIRYIKMVERKMKEDI